MQSPIRVLLAIFLLPLFTLISAAPTLNWPIQDQRPLVARVDTEYQWSAYPDTFSSSSTLNYTTSALPSWLSFDPISLAFTGTPTSADRGEISITLTATDGSETESTFNILVSSNEAPGIHTGFDTQIADPTLHNFNTATALPSNDSVLLHPYYSFSMGFQQSTFRPGRKAFRQNIYYSAYLKGTTELPSWLNFDNQTVTFSGVAPADGTYVVVVTGSDYWGYSAIQNGFTIQVSTAFIDVPENAGVGNITTVAGSNVNYKLDLSEVSVNGSEASGLTVKVDLDDYDWLRFDASTLALTGTTPEEYINGTVTPFNIPVTISDTVNGVIAQTLVYLPLSIAPSLFSTVSLPNATAQLGQDFSYDLRPYLRNTTAIGNLAIAISPSSNYTEWIKLDTDTYELMGVPPNQSSSITRRRHIHRKRVLYRRADARAIVQISATDVRTNLVSVANLNLDLAGLPTAAIPTPTSSSSPTGTTAAASSGKGGLSSGAKIALGVVLGLLGAALLAALIWFCCFRRRKEKKQQKSLEKSRKSTESFAGMIKSPKADRNPFHNFALFGTNPVLPRSESAKLQNGEVPKFNSIYVQRPSAEGIQEPVRAVMDGDNEKPRQMDAMRGILRWDAQGKRMSNGSHQSVPGLDYPSPVPGEIIRNDSLMPPGDGSDFTHSFGSSSESRASWESKETFQWSSAEGAHAPYRDANGRPLSSAPSVPRPRNDFTPRYPRNALATGTGRPPSDTFSGHTFSEFHDQNGSHDHGQDSLTHTHTGTGDTSFGTGSLSHTETHSGSGTLDGSSGSSQNGVNYELATRAPAGFANGPSALGRIIGESGHFAPVTEEEEGYSDESAVLAVAERQSFDQQEAHRVARLMPSRERFTQSPNADLVSVASHTPSQEAIAENSDAFDDADEEGARDRASTVYAPSDLTGLGYPAEAIVFGNRASQALSLGQRSESMRFVPPPESEIMSPPLPQVGNMLSAMSPPMDGAYRPISTGSAVAGRYIACQNETFNLHPHINPPPQVSLSAATWSAPAPSTYRIEGADGAALPAWLHWDGKELELWGIPSLADAGQVLDVRVIERIPKPKRKSYDSSQLTPGEATEREVGACIIEVADSVRSPDAFSLDGFSSAMGTNA